MLAGLVSVLGFFAPARPSAGIGSSRLIVFDEEPHVRVRLSRIGPGPWRLRPDSESARDLVVRRPDGTRLEVGRSSLIIASRDERLYVNGIDRGAELHIEARDGDGFFIGDQRFRGRLRFNARGGNTRPILSLLLEDYLAQVLPREMPLSFPEAALAAQAIAARSYAVGIMLRRRSRGWDLVDSEASQVFGELDAAALRARATVEATRFIVLAWEGRPLTSFFSASCGGHTRSPTEAFGGESQPPLAGVLCGFCKGSPDYRWEHSVKRSRFERALDLDGKLEAIRSNGSAPSGYDARFIAETDAGPVELSARRLRSRLGHHRLKSTWITDISLDSGRVVVKGRGFGHGVGLCQQGARGLAQSGRDARRILEHYFPGAELAELGWREG